MSNQKKVRRFWMSQAYRLWQQTISENVFLSIVSYFLVAHSRREQVSVWTPHLLAMFQSHLIFCLRVRDLWPIWFQQNSSQSLFLSLSLPTKVRLPLSSHQSQSPSLSLFPPIKKNNTWYSRKLRGDYLTTTDDRP